MKPLPSFAHGASSGMPFTALMRLFGAICAMLGVAGALAAPTLASAEVLLQDGFNSANGPNNLITNEYAAWHSTDVSRVDSPVWQSDGGSLFSVGALGPNGTAA